jgi:16S rRNA C1402 (ribose-2'-O) methylase RsmI
MVFYVPPHKLLRVLTDMHDIMGADRQCCVARELTKIHETFLRGSLADVLKHVEEHGAKGEVTLLVEGSRSARGEKVQGFGATVCILLSLTARRHKLHAVIESSIDMFCLGTNQPVRLHMGSAHS